MRCHLVVLAIAGHCFASLSIATGAKAQGTINNWQELRAAFANCWAVPPGTGGSVVAFQFGLNPAGELRGEPRVIATKLVGNREAQQLYLKAASDALGRCLPADITKGFGLVIVRDGPIRLRFARRRSLLSTSGQT